MEQAKEGREVKKWLAYTVVREAAGQGEGNKKERREESTVSKE